MTLTTIHTFLRAGLTAYQTGGTDWQIQSGVLLATTFDEVDAYRGPGKIVYGWLGAGRTIPRTSPFNYDCELPIFVRGKIVGDLATLQSDVLAMTDDIIRAILIGDETPSSEVYGRIEIANFSESLISNEDRTAEVLVIATVKYDIEVAQ